MKVQLNTLFPLTEKYQQKKLLEYFDTMGQVEKAGNVRLEHFKQKRSGICGYGYVAATTKLSCADDDSDFEYVKNSAMGEDSETEDELNSSDDWDNATNTADNFADDINSENETQFPVAQHQQSHPSQGEHNGHTGGGGRGNR